ncbi:branched-chain amino acid transport system II carrier protein [Lederbergia citrea]|uniref:Branched-chain amino acid transport system carrier protein n=1 Tax=Lederbergia citrea TaxID=2833581 RepID=A0A942Z6V5_9BACI|nr:branched-chain amino acid transport system II carrier protein [Lederbergia citrea]MBS4179422.1 branched-chain amino acid transport system II carrier protein [Lederbergia citrea]MBS4206090.1 branched-chain amino acid transport system II carrier protein [Lederbergia citrea]MBS4224461.1 branched-chain amino acid transport system II carrier protein [Lederbergia citrea]
MKRPVRDSIIIGLALFATFFGAGNLIFPPFLGLQSGTDWLSGSMGFIISGVIFPIIAIYIISHAGGTVDQLTKKVHPKFSQWILLGIMLFSSFIAIPRTGAVTHELGIQAVFPSIPAAPIVIIFFALTYYFVNDRNNVIDKLGAFLTPALVIILIAIIINGVITPVGEPVDTDISSSFVNAFLGGYQTGDLLVSFMVASVFISHIVGKGYRSEKERNKMTGFAGLIAFSFLVIIYSGLLYLGASGSGIYPQNMDRSELLLAIVETILGKGGLYGLGIVVALACLTTAIGLTTAVAQFFDSLTNGKLSYKTTAGIVCALGIAIALLGVDRIVFIATPLYLAIYPICIVVILVGIFHRHLPNTASFQGAVLFTVIISVGEAMTAAVNIPFLSSLIGIIPLSSYGFAWFLPAMIGFVGGAMIGRFKEKEKGKATEHSIVN